MRKMLACIYSALQKNWTFWDFPYKMTRGAMVENHLYNIFHTFVTAKPAEQMFVSKLGFKFLIARKKVDITISKFRDEITVYSQAKIVLFSREKVTR